MVRVPLCVGLGHLRKCSTLPWQFVVFPADANTYLMPLSRRVYAAQTSWLQQFCIGVRRQVIRIWASFSSHDASDIRSRETCLRGRRGPLAGRKRGVRIVATLCGKRAFRTRCRETKKNVHTITMTPGRKELTLSSMMFSCFDIPQP